MSHLSLKFTLDQLEKAKEKLNSITVPIKIGTTVYDVSSIEKTKKSPKSDFHFLDIKGNEIVWISHKDGKRASDFQQWSGITEPSIIADDEVKNFVATIKLVFPLGIDKGVTVARKIANDNLKMKSVYGVNYGKSFGQQNVTLVMQGPIDIHPAGKYYKISANHVLLNGDDSREDYEPALMAMYKSDRSQFNVKNARFAIYPIGGRRINDWI